MKMQRAEVHAGGDAAAEQRLLQGVTRQPRGALVHQAAYADKPLLNRVHSGEWFGDGGLVFAMFWAIALVTLTTSGLVIYWTMRRRNATGLQRVFW